MFAVGRLPSASLNSVLMAINWSTDSNRYAHFRMRNDATSEWDARLNEDGRTAGGWYATDGTDWTGDTNLHTILITMQDNGGGTGTLSAYEDSNTLFDADGGAGGTADNMDRLTIGRNDRAASFGDVGQQVFAAGAWERQLTTDEIQEVMDDPYAYLGTKGAGTYWGKLPFNWFAWDTANKGTERILPSLKELFKQLEDEEDD